MTHVRYCVLALTTALLAVPSLRAQEAPAAAPGVEVMARGPIHEAYAESVAGQPGEAPIVAKKPPEPIEEMPPDQKPDGDNVQWMPGYWAFDEAKNDYLWISGFWRTPPPNRQWVPGHWKEANGGWQWVAGFWGGTATEEVTYLAPPPAAPVEAAPPPQPSKNHVYVPGCWMWRDDHYVWRPGYWLECRSNWVWVPAHYVWSPCGYVFVEGYWDYTLKERGVLFAPVYVDVAVVRPGYVYTPTVIVHDDCLYGAMFVRPGCRTYYYGDYFEERYVSAGYVSWCSVSVGYSDPMYSYYRWEHRDEPNWEVSLQFTYNGRYKGDIPRPATKFVQNNTTIVQNNTIVNNTINNTTINNNNTANNNTAISAFTSSPLVPMSQASAAGVKMQPISAEARQAHAVAAKQVVQASQHRAQTEAHVLSQGPPPTKPTDKPRSAKLDLPKPPASAARPTPTGPAGTHPASPSGVMPASHTAAPGHQTSPAGTTPTHNVTAPTRPGTTPGAGTTPGHTQPAPAGTTTPTHNVTAPTHPGTTTPGAAGTAPSHPGTTTPSYTQPGTTTPSGMTHPGTTPGQTTTPQRPGTTPNPARPGTTPPGNTTRPPQPPARPAPPPSNQKPPSKDDKKNDNKN
jgi:hypothetical protein